MIKSIFRIVVNSVSIQFLYRSLQLYSKLCWISQQTPPPPCKQTQTHVATVGWQQQFFTYHHAFLTMYSCICDLNVTFLTSESLTPHKVLQTNNNNNNKSLTTFNIFLVSLLSSQGKNSHKKVFRINIFFTEYDCLDYEYLIFSYNNHYSHIPCGVWGCHWKTGENSMQWRLTGDTYVEFTESNSFCRPWVFQKIRVSHTVFRMRGVAICITFDLYSWHNRETLSPPTQKRAGGRL